jgi:DNA-binding NarL/FixJ family response regulator
VTSGRKIAYRPRPNRLPSPDREKVRERLLKGWTRVEMARDLGICLSMVNEHVSQIYQQHGVRGRAEFAKLCGVELPAKPESKRDKVRRRLMAGQSYAQIETEMGITRRAVWHHVVQLLKRGVAIPHHRQRIAERRATILRLFEEGLSSKQIALKLRMSYYLVRIDIRHARRDRAGSGQSVAPAKA